MVGVTTPDAKESNADVKKIAKPTVVFFSIPFSLANIDVCTHYKILPVSLPVVCDY